ncbi:endonuclease/exonuclease/phosphatase family protein [Phosphitispora sp. TUW77]|uniref:endonuclease/exonuclease/phosphatase family protein n=1 Tax=Phosphitispora sp. TUW77 TaxID=3152361 RepID=UPI003AB564A7
MTYNVHSCIDVEKRNSLDRICNLIKKERPSIIGLNEVESFSPRVGFVNQPKRLAAARNMVYSYGPAIKFGPIGFFGNAILSRYPIYESKNFRLSSKREQRCCLRTRLRIPEGYITVFITHLGLNRQERFEQISELERLVAQEKNPVILMGDFNCGMDQLRPLYRMLSDAGSIFGSQPTFSLTNPKDRIDYILFSAEFECRDLIVAESDSSDHLPVIADLHIANV